MKIIEKVKETSSFSEVKLHSLYEKAVSIASDHGHSNDQGYIDSTFIKMVTLRESLDKKVSKVKK